MQFDTVRCSRFNRRAVKSVKRDRDMHRDYHAGAVWLLLMALTVAGCTTGPTAKVHHSLQRDAAARPLEQVVLLPVDVDVYEMSAGGVKEQVPEWSRSAEDNIRAAMLVSKDPRGKCCVTREVDTSALTAEEREIIKEHLALFNLVANNAMWATLPANSAWHFKADAFRLYAGQSTAFSENQVRHRRRSGDRRRRRRLLGGTQGHGSGRCGVWCHGSAWPLRAARRTRGL